MLKKLDRKFFLCDIALLIYIALGTTIAHLIIGGNYGYFLDELYTIACSKHLSLAFVDIPPVAPLLLALNRAVFGESLFALHILPSLFSGAVVVMAGLMARELGGGRLAVLFTGLAAAFVPVWMALGSLYTYDFLDQFVIISLFYALLLLIKRENPKLWLLIGAIVGIGFMTKPSMLFFVLAIAVALLCTRHRKMYLTPWPWLGALVGLVIILPAFLWQMQNSIPIAQYWVAYSGNKTVSASPAEFLVMQAVGMNVILLPLWLTGLWYVLFHKEGRKYRLLGVIYLLLFVLFLATGAKLYMLIPAYAMLLAAGAVSMSRLIANRNWKWMAPVYAAVIVITGAIQAPNFMPILPVDSLIKYYDSVGGLFGVKNIRLDADTQVEIPQYFYDRFEWDVLVRDVAEVYNGLPEDVKADTAVVTQNYGWAGAIDLFGAKQGLPKAVCGQLNYYFFSLGDVGKKTWLMIGGSREELLQFFDSVELAKVSETTIRKPYQTPLYLCTKPKFTKEEAVVGIKSFR